MEKSLSKDLKESLKRHMELLGYDPKKGKSSLTEVRRHKYTLGEDAYTDYAEGDEEETEEGGDNADFDFGGDEGGEDTGGEFDFGGDEGGKEGEGNAEFDFGGEETDTEETDTEETDEFGTADEFSAADDIESDEDSDVEEIDVTDIVKRADDAKGYAEKAVSAAEEGKNMIKDLMSKFETLQQSLGAIETVKDEVTSIKKDIQAQKPKEKLELRSLDSYPFNVKLTDYWNDEKIKDNYEITSGAPDAQSQDGEVKVWKVTPEDAKDYNTTDIKKSFMPESRSKKKVLTESFLGYGLLGLFVGIFKWVAIPLGIRKSLTNYIQKIKENPEDFDTSITNEGNTKMLEITDVDGKKTVITLIKNGGRSEIKFRSNWFNKWESDVNSAFADDLSELMDGVKRTHTFTTRNLNRESKSKKKRL